MSEQTALSLGYICITVICIIMVSRYYGQLYACHSSANVFSTSKVLREASFRRDGDGSPIIQPKSR
jgi:hypothetical protein